MTRFPLTILAALLLFAGLVASHLDPRDLSASDQGSRADQPPIRLELNVPAFRLDVIVNGSVNSSYKVAVGMLRYPTPIRDYEITEIVWNPWWYPPPSDWARDERPMPPGPDNPMGRVKLQASQYIFIHGTPDLASLGQAASHGCIRMDSEDAMEIARQVVSFGAPGVTAADLDVLETNPRRTRAIRLDFPVPFSAAYRVAEVRSGILELHPDVYGRGPDREEEALRALAEAGIGRERGDLDRLGELLRTARREHVAVPVDSIVALPAEFASASRGTALVVRGGSRDETSRASDPYLIPAGSPAFIGMAVQEGC